MIIVINKFDPLFALGVAVATSARLSLNLVSATKNAVITKTTMLVVTK
jgi:hypothetical protein